MFSCYCYARSGSSQIVLNEPDTSVPCISGLVIFIYKYISQNPSLGKAKMSASQPSTREHRKRKWLWLKMQGISKWFEETERKACMSGFRVATCG
jgi:hypothetical protein